MRKTQILKNKPVYLELSILDLSETFDLNFGMIMENQNLVKMQNFITWIQTVSLLMKKEMIFTKMLQKMLKKDLAIQILK